MLIDQLFEIIGDAGNAFQYTGQELDDEWGEEFYYYGSRYYIPELRLFTQADPFKDDYPGLSPYTYCANNPMKYIDPNGEEIQIIGDSLQTQALIQGIQDASGTELTYDTEIDEKTGIYTLTLTGYESTDDRFGEEQGYLSELIEDDDVVTTVQFSALASRTGGGAYDSKDQTVHLAFQFQFNSPNVRGYYYWHGEKRDDFWGLLGKKDYEQIFTERWDAVAHELFGHAYDYIKGKGGSRGSKEGRAMERTNKVREKYNKPVRSTYDKEMPWW